MVWKVTPVSKENGYKPLTDEVRNSRAGLSASANTLYETQLKEDIAKINALQEVRIKETAHFGKPIKQKGVGMLKTVRNYLEEHRNIVVPVLLVVIADHFLLKGIFRKRLEAMLNKLLESAENKVTALTEKKE